MTVVVAQSLYFVVDHCVDINLYTLFYLSQQLLYLSGRTHSDKVMIL